MSTTEKEHQQQGAASPGGSAPATSQQRGNAVAPPSQNDKLKADLAKVSITPAGFDAQCRLFFQVNGKRLSGLASSEAEARSIFLCAMNAVSRSPDLLQAAMQDFLGFARCIATSCELKLYPGPMQECAYVPLKSKRTGKLEVNFWPMYQGLVKLAYNGGFVKVIRSGVVYENDEFDYELGTNEFIRHVPRMNADRGERVCAWAVIATHTGNQPEIMDVKQIEGIRRKSAAGGSDYSPWSAKDPDMYDLMARKTVLKRAMKYVPKSIVLNNAIELDNSAETGEASKGRRQFDLVIDGDSSGGIPTVTEPGDQRLVEGGA